QFGVVVIGQVATVTSQGYVTRMPGPRQLGPPRFVPCATGDDRRDGLWEQVPGYRHRQWIGVVDQPSHPGFHAAGESADEIDHAPSCQRVGCNLGRRSMA